MGDFAWCGQLGALHQFRNVSYVEHDSDGTVMCNLCGTGWMGRNQRVDHFHGQQHDKRYYEVRQREMELATALAINSRSNDIRMLRDRADALGFCRWTRHIHSLLLGHVTNGTGTKQALGQLVKYELMEQVSLLELACWKFHICASGFFSSMEEAREYVVLEENFDVKSFASDMRTQSGCAVIIPHVLEYLDSL